MGALTAYPAVLHCSAEFKLREHPTARSKGFLYLVQVFFYEDSIEVRLPVAGSVFVYEAPHELKVAAACLCAGLMSPSIFADLLEDHRPDLAEAAAFLREWERLHKEQQN